MTGLKIVIHTNIVVSAALKHDGLESYLIGLIAERVFVVFASDALIAEYRAVLSRPKFSAIDPQRVSRLLTLLVDEMRIVNPLARIEASPDEPDNRFLECADAASADYLVTGNMKHSPLEWKATKVVTTREIIRILDLSSYPALLPA